MTTLSFSNWVPPSFWSFKRLSFPSLTFFSSFVPAVLVNSFLSVSWIPTALLFSLLVLFYSFIIFKAVFFVNFTSIATLFISSIQIFFVEVVPTITVCVWLTNLLIFLLLITVYVFIQLLSFFFLTSIAEESFFLHCFSLSPTFSFNTVSSVRFLFAVLGISYLFEFYLLELLHLLLD